MRRLTSLAIGLVAFSLCLSGLVGPTSPAVAASTDDTAQQQAQQAAQRAYDAAHPDEPVRQRTGVVPFTAQAAPSGWDAGHLIDDAEFYNGQAMSAADVQAFLDSKGAGCSNALCIRRYTTTSTTEPADQMCSALAGRANESAASIIARVGAACGISQRVILVLLQKEQSLVATTAPTTSMYQMATGYACPDTSGCDAAYYGLFNQIYWAAWQYKRYLNPPGRTQFFTWLPYGGSTASPIGFSPTSSCGSSNVVIRNAATAALYYYTPYQPDAAALAGGGDACSSFGNLNFFTIFSAWFGQPNADPDQFFTDVPSSATFYPQIQWMARLSLTTGSPGAQAGTRVFQPTDDVSRQAVAAFLYRYNGVPFTPPSTPSFTDVVPANPFYAAIEWMRSSGITTGNADGTFDPEAPVTRQAMAAFLARYAGPSPLPTPGSASFSDVGAGNPFFPAVEWLKSSAISTGNADGTFHPDEAVSRQAMAAFLARLYSFQNK